MKTHFSNAQKSTFLGFALITFCIQTNAQQFIPAYLQQKNEFISQNFDIIDSSGWLKTLPESNISVEEFRNQFKPYFGMSNDDNFTLTRITNDDYPFMPEDKKLTHERYNQTYKGIKVEFAELFIHHKNNRIESINGKLCEGLNISVTPQLTSQQALTTAINHLGADNLYSWQDTAFEASYKNELEDSTATSYPSGELLIAKKNVDQNFKNVEFLLAWKYNILSLNPELAVTIYIDANTGAFIKQVNNLQNSTADLSYGYGNAMYIDTRYRGGIYDHHVLRSNDANAPKIWTKKWNATFGFGGYDCTFLGYCTPNSFDHDGEWHIERASETTAHWVATHAWNYFKNVFGRNGYDNNGTELKILVDYPDANAKWYTSGKYLLIGKINNNHMGTRDIIGHEFTHAVTQYTANLIYMSEPGALSESFSDIFGYEIERFINGGVHTNWDLGEDVSYSRSMNHPSISVPSPCSGVSQPSIYQGPRWLYGNCDEGGVHQNSGVQNYWFYLLSEGSLNALDGTFNNISVSGIGADKARNIAFYNLDNYLGMTSFYSDAHIGSIFAGMNIYGNCSNELTQIINAWAAVGIGQPRLPLTITGPSSISYFENSNATLIPMPINYTASGGNTHKYKWTYTGPWSYSILTSTSASTWENIFSISNFNHYFVPSTIKVEDNCTTVSKTITFNIIREFEGQILLSPNPTSGQMVVDVDFPLADPTQQILIKVYDLRGNQWFVHSYGTTKITLDLSTLPDDNYYLSAQQGEYLKSVQFIKQ